MQKEVEENEEKLGLAERFWRWFDSRSQLSKLPRIDVPKHAMNPVYCLGGITFLAFLIQAVTGMLLSVYYKPSLEVVPGHHIQKHTTAWLLSQSR